MLFERTTIVCQPSAAGRVAAAAGESAARGDGARKLEGAWVTEIGTLCSVVELRSGSDEQMTAVVPSLAERQADLRGGIRTTETALLAPVLPFQPASGGGHVYEWRRYRAQPGQGEAWLKLFVDIMPSRVRYSPLVGLWRSVGGSPDQFDHLWIYDSLDQRMAVRAAVMQDPDWQALLKVAPPMLSEMASTILLPTRYSPLQ
jgi:hypothetical protein